MLLFDIIIGNTDRYQDNWGIIIEKSTGKKLAATLSPAYDNGTSLGYEILDSKIVQFDNPARRLAYIRRGKHHLRSIVGSRRLDHFELITELLKKMPSIKPFIDDFFEVDFSLIEDSVMELTTFKSLVPLSYERAGFALKLMKDRIEMANIILDSSS
jgi:hypothetical protein